MPTISLCPILNIYLQSMPIACGHLAGPIYRACLRLPEGKTRITDKSPVNFLSVGLIWLILPNAKIIHTTRDPAATCFSCFSKLFTSSQDFSYDLAELGRYYRGYSKLMDYWRSVLPPGATLDVAYEELVNDLEAQARRLLDYCGLPWDLACLRFHKTERPVMTASKVQARQPLFRTAFHAGGVTKDLGPLLAEVGVSSSPSR